MALPAIPLSPGTGNGRARLVEGPETWSGSAEPPVVPVVRARWWSSFAPWTGPVRACLTDAREEPAGRKLPVAAVGGVDRDLVLEGESVEVDGSQGTFRIEGVAEVPVVTAFLQRADGRVLLLRRSARVGSFRGRWAGVSGYLEEPTPLDQAHREVLEETGIASSRLALLREGATVLARDGARIFVVHPFLFRVEPAEVRLDWEHTESEWVDPGEIALRETVPKLDRAWHEVAASEDRGKS